MMDYPERFLDLKVWEETRILLKDCAGLPHIVECSTPGARVLAERIIGEAARIGAEIAAYWDLAAPSASLAGMRKAGRACRRLESLLWNAFDLGLLDENGRLVLLGRIEKVEQSLLELARFLSNLEIRTKYRELHQP